MHKWGEIVDFFKYLLLASGAHIITLMLDVPTNDMVNSHAFFAAPILPATIQNADPN